MDGEGSGPLGRPLGRPLAIVLGIALAARAAALVATPGYRPFGDAVDYAWHGWSLAYFHAYPFTELAAPFTPSALRPPGYPVLMAALFKLLGAHETPIRAADALLGVVSVGLVYAIARQLWSLRVAILAALVLALLAPMVWLPASLLSENLFIPLLLAAVYALLRMRAVTRLSLRWAAVVGLCIGAAALTRSTGAALLVPAAVALLGAREAGLRRVLSAGACMLGVLALVLAPWTVRNADKFGRFLPLGTQDGYTYAGTYNSVAAGPGYFQADWRVPQQVPEYAGLFGKRGIDEGTLDGSLRHRAFDYASAHPGYVLTVLRLNALRLFDVGPGHSFVSSLAYKEMDVPTGAIGALRADLYAVLALALAGIGVVASGRARRGPLWIWLVPVVQLAAVVVVLSSPRYRAPVDPFIAILAALAIDAALAAIGPRSRRSRRSRARVFAS